MNSADTRPDDRSQIPPVIMKTMMKYDFKSKKHQNGFVSSGYPAIRRLCFVLMRLNSSPKAMNTPADSSIEADEKCLISS